MEYIWIAFPIFAGFAAGQTDPCRTYQELNDTTLETDNILSNISDATCELFPSTPTPIWFRYMATESGAMANSCPGRLACGARQQIWINGSFPRYSVGETSVPVCISADHGCCVIKNEMLVKNCYTFYVYNLRRAPSCYARYCFNESSPYMETTFSIPTTTSLTSTTKLTKETTKPRTTTVFSIGPKTSHSHSFSPSNVAKTSTQAITEMLSKSPQTATEDRVSLTDVTTESHSSFAYDNATTLTDATTTTTIKPPPTTPIFSKEPKTSHSFSFSTSYVAKTSTQTITEKSPETTTEDRVSLTYVTTESNSSFAYDNATTLTDATTTTTIKPPTTTPVFSTEPKTSNSLPFSTSYVSKTSTQTITDKSPETTTEASVSFVSGIYQETTSHEYFSETTDRLLPDKDYNYTQTGSMLSTFQNNDMPTTSPDYGSKETETEKHEMVVIIVASVSSVALVIISAIFATLFYRRLSGRRNIIT